ncbi:carbohydrate-binding protein [Streptomyces argyrophylli]|uniref:carbohydrate-binding protein n=1 Tax=Streptomyces argyrophylli TaxID=2726118 RepID=UPI0035ABBFB3
MVARRAAARSRRALAASSAARGRSTTRAAAPWARIAGTPAGPVVARSACPTPRRAPRRPRSARPARPAAGREAAFGFVLDVPRDPGPGPGPSSPENTWTPGTAYRTGDRVAYAARAYVCLQPHTSRRGWEPPAVPAPWQAA